MRKTPLIKPTQHKYLVLSSWNRVSGSNAGTMYLFIQTSRLQSQGDIVAFVVGSGMGGVNLGISSIYIYVYFFTYSSIQASIDLTQSLTTRILRELRLRLRTIFLTPGRGGSKTFTDALGCIRLL